MKWALFVLGAMATIAGMMVLGEAMSAIHEILAGTAFTTGAVFISGGAIIEAIERNR